jgi:hypothetical protein
MKTEGTKKGKKEKNWILPGVHLTTEEFVAGIHKAEEGPFYTIEEVQKIRSQWRSPKKNP